MKQALTDALRGRGYDVLTPVQEAVTAADLAGADLVVSARTGSGKTLGFGLAVADDILGDREAFDAPDAPLALVVAPTRELALQVRRELAWLYEGAGAVLASCVGGMDMRDERRALARGAHVVVATPGRLRDHLERGSIDLSRLRAVVLDEADEMLDLGFREDLEFILDHAPAERRTLLFSATVPPAIAALAKRYQRDARRIAVGQGAGQHADIAYHAHPVAPRDVETAVVNVLRFHEAPGAIVFANTRAAVARLTTRLRNRGFAVVSLSGELSQADRTQALQAMRDGRARVCVATDVAARGIDLPSLDLVVHAELPTGPDTLLHRSGRTGRAGRKGVSALVVPPAARRRAERLLAGAKLDATWAPAPSADVVRARDGERMLDALAAEPAVTEDEAGSVDALAARFDARALAAAYLRLRAERQAAPEDLIEVEAASPAAAARGPRAAFGPGRWFSVSSGRGAPLEARRLLPRLIAAGGLSKEDVGAIRAGRGVAHVEIAEARADGFLAALGPDRTLGPDLAVAPSAPPPERPAKGRGPARGPKGAHRKGVRPKGPR